MFSIWSSPVQKSRFGGSTATNGDVVVAERASSWQDVQKETGHPGGILLV